MGISEDARARITVVDGALAGRERWARTSGEGWAGVRAQLEEYSEAGATRAHCSRMTMSER